MAERSNHSQNPHEGNEDPEVYSISQDKDGSFHLSRKDFLTLSAAVGGTLLVRGVCPRFGTKASPGEPAQAGMMPLTRISIHTEPRIASNIADTLQQNDMVRLIRDHPDLGWTEVATQRVQHGWVNRSHIDFSRAVKSSSPDFDLNSSPARPSAQTAPSKNFSVQLHPVEDHPNQVSAVGQMLACGEIIQNGNFESGSVIWVEQTTGSIITDQWVDPYQGSWVAWMGGLSATERLTQLFHVPAYVQDVQKLEFYLKVTSADPYIQRDDVFYLRFLDGVGNPVSTNILIADNTDRTDWIYVYVDISGMQSFADQDLQVQFVAVVDDSYITNFVIDSVSLNMACDPTPTPKPVYYVYLPVIIRPIAPTPTSTPTSTPTPTATSCASYCSSDCSSDCGYDCGSDCTYDCSSDCTFECIYDCTFDCIYDCSYNW